MQRSVWTVRRRELEAETKSKGQMRAKWQPERVESSGKATTCLEYVSKALEREREGQRVRAAESDSFYFFRTLVIKIELAEAIERVIRIRFCPLDFSFLFCPSLLFLFL